MPLAALQQTGLGLLQLVSKASLLDTSRSPLHANTASGSEVLVPPVASVEMRLPCTWHMEQSHGSLNV